MKKTEKCLAQKNKKMNRIGLLALLSILLPICGILSCVSAYASAGSIPIYLTQKPDNIDVTIDDVPSPQTYDEGIAGYTGMLAISAVGLLLAGGYAVKARKRL